MSAKGYYTSNTLIAAIKRKAMIPSNQNTFTNDDFLAFSNEELKTAIVPSVLSFNEEYYVYPELVPLVANQSNYDIPYRALGLKLRDLFYQAPNGDLQEMHKINPEDKALFQVTNVGSSYIFYYIENNSIIITPSLNDSVTGSLLFTYHIRPNELVTEDRVAIISAISVDTLAGTTTYSVDGVPTDMIAGILADLQQAKPGHRIREFDLEIVSTDSVSNPNTITLTTADIEDSPEIGDHITFAGECIIPQCPTDLHPILAQRVAARCLEALGDTQGLTNANVKIQELEVKAAQLIDNRVIGSPLKVANKKGLLGNSVFRRRHRSY